MGELKGKTFHIITFGCQMNEHDSENMAGLLSEEGCASVEDRKDADIVIINTCSVRENADKRFFGTLGQLKKQKAIRKDFTACVCGCMMQQEHIVDQVRQRYPWVDVVFGTHNIHELPEMLEELYDNRKKEHEHEHEREHEHELEHEYDEEIYAEQKGNEDLIPEEGADYTLAKHSIRSSRESRVIRVYEDREDITEGLPAERMFPHKAFVNIMFGCNNFCTYCIVPYTRGREKSRRPEDILGEVRRLVDDGVREVTLLGQNVNSYRGDGWDFADLVYALDEVEGLDRIRFMTSHPKDMSERLIKAFSDCDKLCRYVHLPVQAGSSRVLRRMNRKYDRDQYLELVEKLRKASPELTISTDIIVGFPGETEEDFLDTLDLVERVRYDSAFTFLYSPRKGTPAAGYEDQIPEEIKHERFDRLVEVMNRISAEKNQEYIGRTFDVLVDGPAKKTEKGEKGIITLSGRTDGFKLVDFKGDSSLAGNMVRVRITGSRTFSLSGEMEGIL